MLKTDNTLLLVIDVQEKLFRVMPDKEALAASITKLIRGCRLLEVPVIVTEQNPAGIGPTISDLDADLSQSTRLIKYAFSCCAEEEFLQSLERTGRKQIIICGIESHICVYQTAMDLLKRGYEVYVVSDGVSSRTAENRSLALRRLEREGVKLTGVEMTLFELLRTSKSEQFKAVSSLIK